LATQIELLANVQIVDQRLHAKTLEVSETERLVAGHEAAVSAQEQITAAARAEFAGLGTQQRDLEGRLLAAETKMKDRRMRITRIRNDKELGLARREVELLKEETGTLETELVGVLDAVEAARARLKEAEESLAQLTAARDAAVSSMHAKLTQLTQDIERERAMRSELIETVDGELRRRYEMILSRRGGVAVVEVRGGICLGCRMRVPPQLFNEIQRNERVQLCPSCQRMLYWRPDTEEKASS
jgi:hypothetical protein